MSINPRSTVFLSQPVSDHSSLGGPCCTRVSTFPQLWVNDWIESQLLSRLHHTLPPPHWPYQSPPAISIDDVFWADLHTCSIMTSKCISKLARSRPPKVSLNSLNPGCQVYLQTHSITAWKFARWWPPKSLDYGLELHLWVHSISASKSMSKLARWRPPSTSLSSHNHNVMKQWSSHGIEREFVRMSGYGSRSVRKGWEDMKGYWAVRNEIECVDLWMLGKTARNQALGKIAWGFRVMRWCLSSLVSPQCLLPIAQSISVIPVSPYAPCWLPPPKQNGSGGEKHSFQPQYPPCTSLSSPNWYLQMLLWLPLSTVCSQIDCRYVYRVT